MTQKTLLPDGWATPRGYANGISAQGRMVFVAGQIGWQPDGTFASDDLVDQIGLALDNVLAVLACDGAGPEHVARMTWYVIDKADYAARTAEIGAVYRLRFGAHYPAMTLVEVRGLLEDRAKVEIECTAVVPG